MWAYTFSEEAETVRFGLGVIAGIVASIGVIVAALWRPIKPIVVRRRVARNAALAATIAGVMRPEIDGIRAAARQQHDEQNGKLDAISEQLSGIASAHGDHLARHDVEIAVLQARDPNARQRKDDR